MKSVFTTFILLLITVRASSGTCIEDGILIKNNTRWRKDSCSSCTCLNGLVTCDVERCTDPVCDTTKGESLIIPANKCCPVCTRASYRHCEADGSIIAHNTEWNVGNCTKCKCRNGSVNCTPVICEPVQCGYGEVEGKVPGRCCPICVSREESCIYEGKSYRDGGVWSSSKCERSLCSRGEVVHYVAQCEDIVCGAGQSLLVMKDECCPTCTGISCLYQGKELVSGESFKIDECETCVCMNGHVTCKRKSCLSDQLDVRCSDGESRVTKRGECCPSCVSAHDSCHHNGSRYFPGDMWTVARCQVASCRHGNVQIRYVQCSPVQCKKNEQLIHTSCCPECLPLDALCRHNGYDYRHGDVWQEGRCKRCECLHGMVQCFDKECEQCHHQSIPVNVPGKCCPDCQLVTCHTDCAACDAPGYAHCTSCKMGRLLQEGKCVRRCQPGFYQDGLRCSRCDPSCSTCQIGNSPSTCMSCHEGLYLQGGRCVATCDDGFYKDGSKCIECRKGCSVCRSATDCLKCSDGTRIPQGQDCVKTCSAAHYFSNNTCSACHHSCATCSGDGRRCSTCPAGWLTENDLCVVECSSKYYQLSITRCAACHQSCASCTGSSYKNCLTCSAGSYLYNGQCLPRCPASHYPDQNQHCKACHTSCRSCSGASKTECTSCSSHGYVIQPNLEPDAASPSGQCLPRCEPSYYLDGFLCRACHHSCKTCTNPIACSSCTRESDVIMMTSWNVGTCVTAAKCHEMHLSTEDGICYNRSMTNVCEEESAHSYNGECLDACPGGTFSLKVASKSLCLHCSSHCHRCSSMGQCDKCIEGRYLSRLSDKCVETCEPGYYASLSAGSCEVCPSSCATCSKPSTSAQPTCTSCHQPDQVLQNGRCTLSCAQQFYADFNGTFATSLCRECDWSCVRCKGPSADDCLECMPGYKLQDGSCVEQCSVGFYLSHDECLPCYTHCKSCDGPNHCSSCQHRSMLHKGQCLSTCPRRYFADASTGTCRPCPDHCISCLDHDTCLQCNSRTFLIKSMNDFDELANTDTNRRSHARCVAHCGKGYYGNKKSRVCVANRHKPTLIINGRLHVGIRSRVLVDIIRVTDDDTELSDVRLILTMDAAHGWFEINNTRLTVGGRVSYLKVLAGSLWFIHGSTEQQHGVATFQATDGRLTSESQMLEVTAISKIAPIIFKKDPLVVRAGSTTKLNALSGFIVKDDDNAYDVTITVIYPPIYGHMARLPKYESAIESFKITDLQNDVIMYIADTNMTSSGELYDSVNLQISDKFHIRNTVLHITITPQISPLLINNRGTRIVRGGITPITNQHLQVLGENIKDTSQIVYILNPNKQSRGELVLMVPELSDAPARHDLTIDDWMQTSQGHYTSRPLVRFTQRDVDEGYLWYRFNPDDEEEEEDDDDDDDDVESFEFEVFDESSDVTEPIASDSFEINVVRRNKDPPRLARGVTSPPHMSAHEGRMTVLHSGYLHYIDDDTTDRELIINITRPLPPSFGTIEHADHPYVPVTIFTQADIDANKIMYRPPIDGILGVVRTQSDNDEFNYEDEEHGSLSRPEIEFGFTVSDGEHVLPSANFTITLTSGESEAPVFVNQKPFIEVHAGESVIIGTRQLEVRDPDTPSHNLIFTLIRPPRHGSVVRNIDGTGMILQDDDAFTYNEVRSNSLQYVHDGSDEPSADQLQVSVTDATYTTTKVIQVSITESTDGALNPDPLSELSLVVTEGSKVILTRENLAYTDEKYSGQDIVYHLESEATHGLLEMKMFGPLVPGITFTQDDIDQGRISLADVGTEALTDMVHFRVSLPSGYQLSDQVLTVTINPALHKPPSVFVGEPLIVREGQEAVLTPRELIAVDADTEERDLIVRLIHKPSLGHMLNTLAEVEPTEEEEEKEFWFTVRHLLDGGVFYVQTRERFFDEMNDFFTFQVTDGYTTSITYRLNITIESTIVRGNQPRIRTNVIECRNGHAVLIKNGSLSVTDPDTPTHLLRFTVVSQLKYGKLVKFDNSPGGGMPDEWDVASMATKENLGMIKKNNRTNLYVGSSFTYKDILDKKVCYETTASDNVIVSRRRRDTLDFTLTDGSSIEEGQLNIELQMSKPQHKLTILDPPSFERLDHAELVASRFVMEANTGLTVERGSITTIRAEQLRFTSPGRLISYSVTRDPNVGQLQLAKNNQVINISANSANEFNQNDVDNGYLRYFHPVSQGGGDVFFMFDVVNGPANLRFDIHVNEDRVPPKILTNNGLTVEEGGSAKIMTRQLSATDDSGRLLYEITQAPKWGRLELVSAPGRTATSFTQNDIVSGNVLYVHQADTERSEDQFSFLLTDGTNSIVQSFYITVTPVDNSLPVLENSGIRVQEGVRKTITEFELKASDRDTGPTSITFHVIDGPLHGAVELTTNGKRHVPVTSFTMEDIYESRLSYNHDGTNTLSDRFTFTVSDGTNQQFMISEEDDVMATTVPQIFQIEVVPVDDGTPRLVTNLGLNHLEYMDNKAMSVITKRVLLTEDPDTSADLIFYTLTSEPRHGHLESNLDSGTKIQSFTQADVNMGLIRYVLDGLPEAETRDSFMFNVRDSLPNVVTGNTFNIRWSVISFENDSYTISEEEEVVAIPVRRRGNLNQYAIVLCRTEHGSATSFTDQSSLPGTLDYIEHAGQVQFDERAAEKLCSVQIKDDRTYEGIENFTVELSMPTYALLGNITKTTVYIKDTSDMPTLQLVETQYTVEERDTFVFIPIKRSGDLDKPVNVVCYTESRTALGSTNDVIQSGSDYKSRARDADGSIVTFAPGVATVTCDVKIVDDSLYEDSEEFVVHIVDASNGAKIGKFSEATVTITGPNDAPTVFLTDYKFVFNENAGTVDIPVRRAGSDLSKPTDVWCSTKQADPVSAVAGQDFVATSTKITFRNEETAKICSLTILDDSQNPAVEGNETFIVYLNSVQTATLLPPHEAVVMINDTMDDVPRFEFVESTATVKEDSRVAAIAIQRFGDVASTSSVLCFTRQQTASAEEDFNERSLTETSRITFEAGQTLAYCNVSLLDDEIYESRESFNVQLSSASSDQWYGARVGKNNVVRITITNDEDAPTLEFERAEYSIREPDSREGSRQLTVRVVRTGDVSEVSKVRCSTRDGSAKSGSDYEPKSKLLRFQPGQTSVNFKINILSNDDTEWHETFLIVLGPHDPVNAILGSKSQSTVTILDKDAAGSLVLPTTPMVVSLMHYDDVALGMKSDPSPGYPLVCVTPCDPNYPDYIDTRSLCEEAAINTSAIKFSWEVAMPTEEDSGIPPFETITDNTPFTSVNSKVLDSIYYGRRFHVRCVAQAVDSVTKTGGTPLRSNVVTIATDSGICHNPIVSGSSWNLQAQSFIANLRYIPPEAEEHPNTLHISIKVPHQDGRLPLISTAQLNNLKSLLSRSIDRRQHVCSNLMYSTDADGEQETGPSRLGRNLGFIENTDYSKLSFGPGYDKPYQFDPTVREQKTIDLYKYLNLKSCIWQFDAYYGMNELIDFCGGKVDSDFQLRDSAESQVTVTVPLYVSYIFVTAPRGWGTFEHNTDMQFSFRYSNILWRKGVGAPTDGAPYGRIQVVRIKIQNDGKLVIDFKTQAKFRGLFVMNHRTLPGRVSRMIAPDGLNIEFEFSLTHSESTYDSPYQQWRAVSTYSRKDYSGDYTVELIPCTVSPTQKWHESTDGKTLPCTALQPDSFDIPITFQQTNRPVPVVYTLQTEFQLCNNEKVFMVDPHDDDVDMNDLDYKGAFTKGQTLFGRVLWTPEQDLRSAYHLQLEKVYLCTGRDGYVPYFDPTGAIYGEGPQYGCIEPSKNLQHRFVLLERSNRDAEDRWFHDVPFDAHFSSDEQEYRDMQQLSGVDGFLMKVDALYKVEAGHQWYIQVVYSISADHVIPRVRRTAIFNLSGKRRNKRATSQWNNEDARQNGTNMRGIVLNQSQVDVPLDFAVIGAGIAAALLAIIAVICCCCFCCRRRRKKERKASDAKLVPHQITAVKVDDDDDDDDDVRSSSTTAVNVRTKKVDEVLEKNSQKSRVRVSNVDLNRCEAPLLVTCTLPRSNNTYSSAEKPLLKRGRKKTLDNQIVNDLKTDPDRGTEV